MERTPLVTIGLPVFNGERHLEETIDAILRQDFADFELIIADNGSTDSTPEICDRVAARDRRVVVARSETNRGAAWNYSRLVGMARGAFFKWASDDDLIAPGFLSSCLAAFAASPGAVLVYSRTTLIDDTGRTIRRHPDGMHLPQEEPWERLRSFARDRWLCNACFGLFRTAVLRGRTTLITPNASSDVTLLAQVALAGVVHEVPRYLFFRRVAADSAGLGEFDRHQVAAWFDPRRPRSLRMPMLKVFTDIERWILASDLDTVSRLRTAGVFGWAWWKRRAGVSLWRLRRALRGNRTSSFSGSVAASSVRDAA